MAEATNDWKRQSMISRLVLMGSVLVCCVLMAFFPFFSPESDAGALYIRDFDIDFLHLYMYRQSLETGVVTTEMFSLWGMVLADLVVAAVAIAVPLLKRHRYRDKACVAGIVAAVVQYIVALVYYVYFTDAYFITLAPTWSLALPAIVIELFSLKKRGKI